MRRRIVVMLAALSAATAVTPSAHAADGSVSVSVTSVKQPVGAGLVTTAVCEATATPGAGELPALTSVWCTMNGVQSPTVSAIGPEAVVAFANASNAGPVEICVYGLAVFTPTIGPAYSTTNSLCKFV